MAAENPSIRSFSGRLSIAEDNLRVRFTSSFPPVEEVGRDVSIDGAPSSGALMVMDTVLDQRPGLRPNMFFNDTHPFTVHYQDRYPDATEAEKSRKKESPWRTPALIRALGIQPFPGLAVNQGASQRMYAAVATDTMLVDAMSDIDAALSPLTPMATTVRGLDEGDRHPRADIFLRKFDYFDVMGALARASLMHRATNPNARVSEASITIRDYLAATRKLVATAFARGVTNTSDSVVDLFRRSVEELSLGSTDSPETGAAQRVLDYMEGDRMVIDATDITSMHTYAAQDAMDLRRDLGAVGLVPVLEAARYMADGNRAIWGGNQIVPESVESVVRGGLPGLKR